jgi:hypothetical protein
VPLVDKGRLFWVCRVEVQISWRSFDTQQLAKKEDEDFNLQWQHEAGTFLAFAFALAHTSANVPQYPSLKPYPNQSHPPSISISPYSRAIVARFKLGHSPANAGQSPPLSDFPLDFIISINPIKEVFARRLLSKAFSFHSADNADVDFCRGSISPVSADFVGFISLSGL